MLNKITETEEKKIEDIANGYIGGMGDHWCQDEEITALFMDFAKEVLQLQWRDEGIPRYLPQRR